jgi:carbonic anhydrase
MVMKEPIQASPAQLALFSRLYPMNARPVQSSSGRVIKESN